MTKEFAEIHREEGLYWTSPDLAFITLLPIFIGLAVMECDAVKTKLLQLPYNL